MSLLTILGTGSALPGRIVSNAELEAVTGFPAARMRELFEIDERHWSRGIDRPDPPEGQRCSDLAAAAASAALAKAGLSAGDVGALLTVTTTPDSLNPPLDAIVAGKLGLSGVPAFTLQAPCTAMFRAVALAEALAPTLDGRPVLVVAAETPSPFFRFGEGIPVDQLMNSLLYADGAGALLLGTSADPGGKPVIEAVDLLLNDDSSPPGITFPAMLSAMPPAAGRFESADYLGHHDFRRVLRRGGRLAADAAQRIMRKIGVDADEVRWFLTHQATGNIRRIVASHGLPPEKFPVNIQRVGNTIGASVLILLDEMVDAGQLSRGDLVVMHTAESATWSSAGMAVRW